MAGSVNKAIIIGNVGKDPEIRTTQGGTKVATFSVATSESWRDRQSGERKERTHWHNVVVFAEPLIEVVEKYLRKGHKVFVEGAMQTRKWTDDRQVEHYRTEVVINPFRGAITLLQSQGGGDRAPAAGDDEYGSDGAGYGMRDTNPDAAREAATGGAVTGNVGARMGIPPRTDGDLDDEIPFVTSAFEFEPHLRKRIIL